jgi:hypothetical protein
MKATTERRMMEIDYINVTREEMDRLLDVYEAIRGAPISADERAAGLHSLTFSGSSGTYSRPLRVVEDA